MNLSTFYKSKTGLIITVICMTIFGWIATKFDKHLLEVTKMSTPSHFISRSYHFDNHFFINFYFFK